MERDGTQVIDTLPGSLPPGLTVELQEVGATCLLTLRGSLTASSAAALEAQIDQLGAIACLDVVVDLAEVDSVDAVGAGIVFGLHHYVRGRGGQLTMIGARGAVADALATDPLAN